MKSPSFDRPVCLQGNACFVSDAHFRTSPDEDSRRREELLVHFLIQEQENIQYLFLLGDIFDFWFEYRDVVPKGYYRLFNILYELKEKGCEIFYFTGNHDMWVQHYFVEQFNCRIFYDQQFFLLNGKRCLIGHGDGIGGRQRGYKIIKTILSYNGNRFLYSMLHPRQAFAIARFFSNKSRAAHPDDVFTFKGEEESQIQYARQLLKTRDIDCFIYAHRHIPVTYMLNDKTYYFNTGDWLDNFSYLIFRQQDDVPCLCYYKTETTP